MCKIFFTISYIECEKFFLSVAMFNDLQVLKKFTNSHTANHYQNLKVKTKKFAKYEQITCTSKILHKGTQLKALKKQ